MQLNKIATIIFLGLLSLFVAVTPAAAQTPTVVTGTVTDANGVPYSFAKVSAQLVPTTASPTIIVNGIPTQIGGQQNANADANGTFSMNLFCNSAGGGCSVISPSGTQWQITVNINGVPPPAGKGPQACTATLTISGASQSVTSSFNACPALLNSTTATPGGSNTQVQYNSTGSLGGNPQFTFTPASGAVTIGTSSTPSGAILTLATNAGGAFNTTSLSTTVFQMNSGANTPIAFGSSGDINGGKLQIQTAAQNGVANTTGVIGYDNVTSTININNSNGAGNSAFTGVWNCTSTTPVTVTANVTTDQTLMACTIPAGTLNRVGRSLRIQTGSIYSTPAASTTAMTFKIKICSVSGCGSGNVLTAATITSGALGTIQVTNNAIQTPAFMLTVQTAGAALAIEAHGCINIDLLASISGADSIYCDNNTTTQVGSPSNIDSTAQNFLQITGAFTVSSASNSWSQRQMVAETIN
jgi:hypothetical protein